MKRVLRSLVILVFLANISVAQGQAPAKAHGDAASAPQYPSAEKIWADLMAGNKRYVGGKGEARNLVQLRHSLAKDQHPKVVVLGCSDSRVASEVLFDQGLGTYLWCARRATLLMRLVLEASSTPSSTWPAACSWLWDTPAAAR
jgi:hypothetical protein